jgi:hypothetical protein
MSQAMLLEAAKMMELLLPRIQGQKNPESMADSTVRNYGQFDPPPYHDLENA